MPNEFHEYTNRDERAAAIKLIEENGLTIKHENFTLKNNKGNHLMGSDNWVCGTLEAGIDENKRADPNGIVPNEDGTY
jgi:hypothetical protein